MPHFAVTRTALAWKNSVRQERNDGSWVNDIRPMAYRHDGEPRTLHAYAPNASLGRKSKMLKSGIRRITYK